MFISNQLVIMEITVTPIVGIDSNIIVINIIIINTTIIMHNYNH